jgi:hypothetical protein
MTQYDFWFAPIKGTQFCCTIGQHEGGYRECLAAAALTWEALTPFGNALTRHPTTGETPEEFRAKHLELSAEDLISRMKPSMLAEFYSDLEETAEGQEGAALVETQRIAGIIHAELVLSVGAEEARERIEEARAKNT